MTDLKGVDMLSPPPVYGRMGVYEEELAVNGQKLIKITIKPTAQGVGFIAMPMGSNLVGESLTGLSLRLRVEIAYAFEYIEQQTLRVSKGQLVFFELLPLPKTPATMPAAAVFVRHMAVRETQRGIWLGMLYNYGVQGEF